jgi:hypothetical protein
MVILVMIKISSIRRPPKSENNLAVITLETAERAPNISVSEHLTEQLESASRTKRRYTKIKFKLKKVLTLQTLKMIRRANPSR